MDDFRALHDGIVYLANLCDGALAQDNQGFSKPHSYFGKRMANIRFEEWDDAMIYTAWDTLRHYKGQLAACGINWDDIPTPPTPNKEAFLERAKHTAKMLSIPRVLKIDPDNGDLLVSWGKNETVVNEFKEKFAFEEKRWDKDRYKGWWIYPQNIATIDKVFEFAERWGITITDEALLRLQVVRSHFEKGTMQQKEIAPKIQTGRYVVPHESNPLEFRVYFDYNHKVYYAISSARDKVSGNIVDDRYKAFVRRYEDNKTLGKNWIITCIDEKAVNLLKQFTDEYGFEYRNGAAERAEQIKHDSEKNKAASSAMDTDFRVRDGLLREPRPFQHAGVQFAVLNGNHLNADEMGCIDGDAAISINRGGAGKKIKLSDLYVKFNGGGTKKWDLSIPTYARSVDDGFFRLNKITGVYDKGEKQTLKVVLSDGKKLHLTPDHQVLTCDGWFEIQALAPGDKILTNGTMQCPSCGTTDDIITSKTAKFLGYCRQCMYRQMRVQGRVTDSIQDRDDGYTYITAGLMYHPNKPETMGIAVHRLIYEAHLNGLSLDDWLKIIFTGNFSDEHVFLDPKIHVHHINENKSDNRLSNLKAVTPTEHIRLHDGYKRLPIFIPKEVEIVEISDGGIKHVYDISVESAHNFVANGIVVHNCGKTFIAIGLTYHLEAYPCLVICPASLKYNWENEIKMSIPYASVSVYEGGEPNLTTDWLIINYDMITKKLDQLLSRQWAHMICDEAHKLKSHKANWSKSVLELSQKCVNRVTLLTGTPLMNKPDDLIMPLRIIGKMNSHFKNISNFQNRYCNMSSKTYGKKTYRVSGEPTNLSELNQHLRNGIMIRRLKKDVLKELPPMTRSIIHLKIDNRSEYEKAERDIVAYVREFAANDKRFLETLKDLREEDREQALREHVNDKAYKAARAEILVQINHLRQIAAKGKLAQVKKWVEEFLESGEKLLIFGYYQSVVEEFGKCFNAPMIYGTVDAKLRQKYVEAFQNDSETNLLVLNMDSGGVGLTLTAASNSVFVELNWNPARITQAEARINRIGQKFPQTIYYFIDPTTIDSYMMDMVLAKQQIINEAIDGNENDGFAIDNEVAERNGMDYANVLLEKYGVEGVHVD